LPDQRPTDLQIDLDSGSVATRSQTEIELGNLVCYQDQLISLSPQSVASFVCSAIDWRSSLSSGWPRIRKTSTPFRSKLKVLLQAGSDDESLALLRKAAALAPDRTTVRDLLVKVMMVLMRKDFRRAHRPDGPSSNKLVTDPAQRREVLRWRVQGPH